MASPVLLNAAAASDVVRLLPGEPPLTVDDEAAGAMVVVAARVPLPETFVGAVGDRVFRGESRPLKVFTRPDPSEVIAPVATPRSAFATKSPIACWLPVL